MRNYWYIKCLLVAACVETATSGLACGPNFPSDVILRDDDRMLAAPVADFAVEINRLKPKEGIAWKAILPDKGDSVAGQNMNAELRELRLAMKNRSPQEIQRAVMQLQGVRDKISKFIEADEGAPQNNGSKPAPPDISLGDSLKDVPPEFADYERGALAYHAGKLDDARKIWTALLNRPADQRKYRSTWAAYMIGRTYEADDKQAIAYFQMTRKMAHEGFADSTGLATASLGWEARAAIQKERYTDAIELYLQQQAASDPTAWPSLAVCANKILGENAAVMNQLVRDQATQRVVTAMLLSNLSPEPNDTAWLKAAESADVQEMAGVDRLAWAAYKNGDMDATERWLDRAPKDSAIVFWLRAKLSLRAGDNAKAAQYLAKAAKSFPAQEEWPAATDNTEADPTFTPVHAVQGELAILKLNRGQYIEALDLLLKAGNWLDAAYIAERVLTPDELKAYVDAQPQAATKPAKNKNDEDNDEANSGWNHGDIRYLLGRRLLRAGRFKDVREYYPEKWRGRVDAYVAALNTGNDPQKKKDERAKALWEAAKIARYNGLALLATELEPDWGIYDANFKEDPIGAGRTKLQQKFNAPSPDELRRLKEQKAPEQRWHYRFVACEYAWAAAALMPDESDDTANVLCEAGGWIKVQDPKAALKFWQALTTRCGTTKLGKDAKAHHWFPPHWAPPGDKNNDHPKDHPDEHDDGDTTPIDTLPPA